jgi:TonB family protein
MVATEGEIGGILLGQKESDDRVILEDFELLPSEHRRGPTFTLSFADQKKLVQRLRASHGSLQTVGSFRTHLRQGLYMDQYDFDLMSNHFIDPTDIMLLIRPNDWKAGVFVWEEGDIRRQKSYKEFSFDPNVLPFTTIDAVSAAASAPRMTVLRRNPPPAAWGLPALPIIAKVGLIAATFGVVGVLAFYAHGHRTSAPVSHEVVQIRATPPAVSNVNAPIDPDLGETRSDSAEMHVKIPVSLERPAEPVGHTRAAQAADVIRAKTASIKLEPQPTPPAPLPAVQTAANLPPSLIAPVLLTPTAPPPVSVVSLEPAEPGILSRGINRIPVLNLLQRNYRAGDKFLPARPIRQVKPRLPAELQHDNVSPPPVDVKVWIDKSGQVTKAELLSDTAEPELGEIASNAALKWTFEPARLSDHAIPSEMVMHFRFMSKQNY